VQVLDGGKMLDRAGWRNPSVVAWQVRAALLHRSVGQLDEAVALAEDHHRRALAWGSPNALGRADGLLGILTPGQAGIDHLRRAVEAFQGTGNGTELAWVVNALGRRVRPEAGVEPAAPVARVELSPAETTVAELAAGGLGNGDIAERLGISRRAVEKHLTSAYRKLGIRGRAQLAGALDR